LTYVKRWGIFLLSPSVFRFSLTYLAARCGTALAEGTPQSLRPVAALRAVEAAAESGCRPGRRSFTAIPHRTKPHQFMT